MSKLLITTQVYENYAVYADGTFGTGANAYWKPKGGNDYVVKNVDETRIDDIIVAVSEKIQCDNDAYRETVMYAEVVEDDFLTDFELSQLEYDGRIAYPATEVEV
jgi:hypothetical protein